MLVSNIFYVLLRNRRNCSFSISDNIQVAIIQVKFLL